MEITDSISIMDLCRCGKELAAHVAVASEAKRRCPRPVLGQAFFHPMMLELEAVARKSGCQKSARAVRLLRPAKQQSFAYDGVNHPAAGLCDASAACQRDCARICIHAEEAVLLNAGKGYGEDEVFHLKVKGGRGVASGMPSCIECAKLTLEANVSGMWLLTDAGWRRWTARQFYLETLQNLGLYLPRGLSDLFNDAEET